MPSTQVVLPAEVAERAIFFSRDTASRQEARLHVSLASCEELDAAREFISREVCDRERAVLTNAEWDRVVTRRPELVADVLIHLRDRASAER